jgi:NAD(P)-dependent dehydrogenase (short-subunit alcohol dehydrogenase family)
LILGVRSQSKGEAAKQSILSNFSPTDATSTGQTSQVVIDVWLVDLSSFSSVLSFATRVKEEVETLDIVILNAAVAKSEFQLSGDGWEEVLQVNLLSTVFLALLLLPKLRQSSLRRPGWTARLSVVASRAHQNVNDGAAWQDAPNVLDALNQPNTWGASGERYSVSKLLLIYAVREIAKLATTPDGKCAVIVNYSCPGACKSDLARDWNQSLAMRALLYFIRVTICKTAEEGARTIVLASVLEEESHGRWIHNDRFEEFVHLISQHLVSLLTVPADLVD